MRSCSWCRKIRMFKLFYWRVNLRRCPQLCVFHCGPTGTGVSVDKGCMIPWTNQYSVSPKLDIMNIWDHERQLFFVQDAFTPIYGREQSAVKADLAKRDVWRSEALRNVNDRNLNPGYQFRRLIFGLTLTYRRWTIWRIYKDLLLKRKITLPQRMSSSFRLVWDRKSTRLNSSHRR